MDGMGLHFARIVAFLGYDTSQHIYPAGTFALNGPDRTLRIHDGCTRGGIYQLALTPRCGETTTDPAFDIKNVDKGEIKILTFDLAASEATPELLIGIKMELNADFMAYPNAVSQIPDLRVNKAYKLLSAQPEVILIEGKSAALSNFEKATNNATNAFGFEAKALPDTLDGQGRLAVRGPALAAWDLDLTFADGRKFSTAARTKGKEA